MRLRILFATLALAVFPAVFLPAGAGAGSAQPASGEGTTAVTVQVLDSPRYVPADDRHTHVEYDLVITNTFPAAVTLKSLVVQANGRDLLKLKGEKLAAYTHPLSSATPTRTLPPASAAESLVDLILPRGSAVPGALSTDIRYAVAPNPVDVAVGSHKVRVPRIRVDHTMPTVIAPPLRGPGWLDANGCCAPDTPHRYTLLPTNGELLPIETFAIDWIRVRHGVIFHGDGTGLGDYVAYGAKIHSVAAGTVVSAVNNRPEPPINSAPIAPGVHKPSQFLGNGAVVRIAPGKYAVYAHMQRHSVRVKVGQRVRAGQVLGLLGNSGNSTAPHLHFSIQDGPRPLSSTSLPFVFDRFRFQGLGEVGPSGLPRIVVTGKPHHERRAYQLIRGVADFSR
jgi:Peptidase family M23